MNVSDAKRQCELKAEIHKLKRLFGDAALEKAAKLRRQKQPERQVAETGNDRVSLRFGCRRSECAPSAVFVQKQNFLLRNSV